MHSVMHGVLPKPAADAGGLQGAQDAAAFCVQAGAGECNVRHCTSGTRGAGCQPADAVPGELA